MSKIKALVDPGPVRTHLRVHSLPFSCCVLTGQKARESSLMGHGSHPKGFTLTNESPPEGPPPLTIAWGAGRGLRISTYEFQRGHIQSIAFHPWPSPQN